MPRRLLFTAAIFTGSFLLFLVQPMMARMALPRLGGAPAVWNSAMLVYQALLLAGYAYAHWLARFAPRRQALVHLALFLVAALFLPIGLAQANPPTGGTVILWAPWLFLASIGPLFFIVSAQAPLLQHWFARGSEDDPYSLYAASNLGSCTGLLAYPFLLEPFLPVPAQSLLWTGGYAFLFLLLLGCAVLLPQNGAQPRTDSSPVEALPARSILGWLWLAFIPSGLMLSTSLFITTDIMAAPLLWVLPLGLYLISFTIAFSGTSRAAGFVTMIAPYLLVPAAACIFIGETIPLAIRAAILLVALFAVSTACHFKLYLGRPHPRQLTGFYLMVALGGVLGGLFVALVAPLIFDWTYEHPLLLLAAAATLLPVAPLIPVSRLLSRVPREVATIGISVAVIGAAVAVASMADNEALVRYGAVAALIAGFLSVGSRVLFVAVMVAAMVLTGGWQKLELSATPGAMTRTYYGVYTVREHQASRHLLHGSTLHGVQLLSPGWEDEPTSYYARESGVGRALSAAPAIFGPRATVGVVGLGAGTLACYRQPGQRWTFFELDPAVVEIATDSDRFSFIERCAPDAHIVIGDARLKLAEQPPASADVLVVDAFSSDAIPMHLLTREAFAVYGDYLKPTGLLLVHISNRSLDLEPVVAAAPGWQSRLSVFAAPWDYRQITGSDWMALSRSPETLEALVRSSGGTSVWTESSRRRTLWTDDYASLLSALR